MTQSLIDHLGNVPLTDHHTYVLVLVIYFVYRERGGISDRFNNERGLIVSCFNNCLPSGVILNYKQGNQKILKYI